MSLVGCSARRLSGYIEWRDEPEVNARRYRHVGCDTPHSHWTVPLDDCPPPSEATDECAHCCYVVPLRPGLPR